MRLGYYLKRIQDGLISIVLARKLFSRDHWTVEKLAAFQRQMLRSVVRHAISHSPFYRNLYAHIDPDKLFGFATLLIAGNLKLGDNVLSVMNAAVFGSGVFLSTAIPFVLLIYLSIVIGKNFSAE
ncbi:MAG TPA: hypothetical protein VMU10_02185 [Desulfomonilia bacterium]|nr:hypothetical protein [Desulfomonilia bacterium]